MENRPSQTNPIDGGGGSGGGAINATDSIGVRIRSLHEDTKCIPRRTTSDQTPSLTAKLSECDRHKFAEVREIVLGKVYWLQ